MDKRNRLIVALADLVDFDFDTERYRLAGSYEKALDICFEQLIESLNHNNSMTYDVAIATVINLKSERITDFDVLIQKRMAIAFNFFQSLEHNYSFAKNYLF
jgi:hypothetical protein